MNDNTGVKQPPQHNTVGTPCNIVANCTSGKPAHYIVGGKYACIEHKDVAYRLAARRGKKQVEASLPEVEADLGFEPEVEVEEELQEVSGIGIRFRGTVDGDD